MVRFRPGVGGPELRRGRGQEQWRGEMQPRADSSNARPTRLLSDWSLASSCSTAICCTVLYLLLLLISLVLAAVVVVVVLSRLRDGGHRGTQLGPSPIRDSVFEEMASVAARHRLWP